MAVRYATQCNSEKLGVQMTHKQNDFELKNKRGFLNLSFRSLVLFAVIFIIFLGYLAYLIDTGFIDTLLDRFEKDG